MEEMRSQSIGNFITKAYIVLVLTLIVVLTLIILQDCRILKMAGQSCFDPLRGNMEMIRQLIGR